MMCWFSRLQTIYDVATWAQTVVVAAFIGLAAWSVALTSDGADAGPGWSLDTSWTQLQQPLPTVFRSARSRHRRVFIDHECHGGQEVDSGSGGGVYWRLVQPVIILLLPSMLDRQLSRHGSRTVQAIIIIIIIDMELLVGRSLNWCRCPTTTGDTSTVHVTTAEPCVRSPSGSRTRELRMPRRMTQLWSDTTTTTHDVTYTSIITITIITTTPSVDSSSQSIQLDLVEF